MMPLQERTIRNLALCSPGPLSTLESDAYDSFRVEGSGYHEGNTEKTLRDFVSDFKKEIRLAVFALDMREAESEDEKAKRSKRIIDCLPLIKELVASGVPHVALVMLFDGSSDMTNMIDNFSEVERNALKIFMKRDPLEARSEIKEWIKLNVV